MALQSRVRRSRYVIVPRLSPLGDTVMMPGPPLLDTSPQFYPGGPTNGNGRYHRLPYTKPLFGPKPAIKPLPPVVAGDVAQPWDTQPRRQPRRRRGVIAGPPVAAPDTAPGVMEIALANEAKNGTTTVPSAPIGTVWGTSTVASLDSWVTANPGKALAVGAGAAALVYFVVKRK